MTKIFIRTPRLILRSWRESDLEPFAAMNADSRVTTYLPSPLTREESDGFANRIQQAFEKEGFGLFAVEISADAPFIGFIGLSVPRFEAHFTPCVEIGWRLAYEHQRKGYATEGARAVVEYGFQTLGLKEIVSFTVPDNIPSRRVMEKIGMTHDPKENFLHPTLPYGHPLQLHVLYRIKNGNA